MQSSVLLATELGLPGYQLVYSGMVIELSHNQVPSRRVSVNEVQNGVSAIEPKHISSKYTVYELHQYLYLRVPQAAWTRSSSVAFPNEINFILLSTQNIV
jgi:tryptophan synthase alpha subunit